MSVEPLMPRTCNSAPAGVKEVPLTWPLDVLATKLMSIFAKTGLAGKTLLGTFDQFLTAANNSSENFAGSGFDGKIGWGISLETGARE